MVRLYVNRYKSDVQFVADLETSPGNGISGRSDKDFIDALLELSSNIKQLAIVEQIEQDAPTT